jgi:hypothetical protein
MTRKFHYETDPSHPTDVGKDLVRGVDRAREDMDQKEPVRPGGEPTPVPPESPAPPIAAEKPAGITVVPLRTQKLGMLVGVAIAACVLFLMALAIKPLISKKDPTIATSAQTTTSTTLPSVTIPPVPTPTVSTAPPSTVHPSATAPSTVKPTSTSPTTSAPALSGWKIEN